MSGFILVLKKIIHIISLPECEICHHGLAFGEKIVCKKCSDLLKNDTAIRTLKNNVKILSAVPYTSFARDLVHSYKFGGNENISKVMAKYICEALDDSLQNIDIITWIPGRSLLSLERGFNQTKLLAKEVCKQSTYKKIKYAALLRKSKATKHQYEMQNFTERFENVKNAYTAIHGERISGKNILIIDDVVTSGATLSECSDKLLECGAKSVSCATFAYADLHNRQSAAK